MIFLKTTIIIVLSVVFATLVAVDSIRKIRKSKKM